MITRQLNQPTVTGGVGTSVTGKLQHHTCQCLLLKTHNDWQIMANIPLHLTIVCWSLMRAGSDKLPIVPQWCVLAVSESTTAVRGHKIDAAPWCKNYSAPHTSDDLHQEQVLKLVICCACYLLCMLCGPITAQTVICKAKQQGAILYNTNDRSTAWFQSSAEDKLTALPQTGPCNMWNSAVQHVAFLIVNAQ